MTRAWVVGGAIAVVLAGALGGLVSALVPSTPPRPAAILPPSDGGARSQILATPIPREGPTGALAWVDKPGQPEIADVNGDGTEDIVGRTEIGESGRAGALFVSAIDGKTLKPFWSAGPYPEIGREGDVQILATQDRVAIMDAAGTAHLLDARNGRQILERPSDRSGDAACAAPSPSAMMWLGPSDGQGVLIDAANARMMTAPRPAWCLPKDRAAAHRVEVTRDGVRYAQVAADAGSAVVEAVMVPGGKTLWAVPLDGPGIATSIGISDTRIYLPRDRGLTILDRASGAKIGRIGR